MMVRARTISIKKGLLGGDGLNLFFGRSLAGQETFVYFDG